MAAATPENTAIMNMTEAVIYKDAHEKHVKTHVAYTPNFGEDRTLYKEPECITPLMPMELYNMFLDGMVINRGNGELLKPFAVSMVNNNYLCYVTAVNCTETFSMLEYRSAPDHTVGSGK